MTTIVKTYGWENVRSGKCRRNFLRETFSESSKKEQRPAPFVENPVKILFSLSKTTTYGFAIFKGMA